MNLMKTMRALNLIDDQPMIASEHVEDDPLVVDHAGFGEARLHVRHPGPLSPPDNAEPFAQGPLGLAMTLPMGDERVPGDDPHTGRLG
jgi:hypothetical protein